MLHINKEESAINFRLDFRYSEANRDALKDVCGSIRKGRCIVLCGSSGCGKSTLLRCINQLIPQFYEGNLKGFCHINGTDTSTLSIGQVGKLAASVFQDPRSQFFTMNSSTELAFGLENFGFTRDEMVKRVDEAFESSGLTKLKDRNVFELSSGERQLTAILAAKAIDTDIYLLDEPTANLDYAAIERLSQLLAFLKSQGRTLFISEHRLYYLSSTADEYWLMENGEIAKRFSREEMLSLSQHELSALGLRTSTLDKIDFMPQVLPEAEASHSLRAEKLCFQYNKSAAAVLNSLNLEAHTSEIIGLIGSNGCGKTTLGKLCAGLYKPVSGGFFFDGKAISQKKLAEKSIFIMQEAEFQFFTNSVINELCYGYERSEAFMAEIKALLKKLDMWQCRNQHPFSLSGGQMQKLVLLLAYLSPKPVVILDEPTAGLDYKSLLSCAGLIRQMQKTKLVFIISHDLELISMVCTRAVAIEGGRAGKEFLLKSAGDFNALRAYMRSELVPAESPGRKPSPRSLFILDPRTKLLIFLIALIAGIDTCESFILCSFAAVALVFLYERQWKPFVLSSALMSLIFLSYILRPCVATAFLISFFPRVILICCAAVLLIREEDAPKTLAALRKLRVPEKLIMIFAVSFRFFPVLRKDLGIMQQSLKTRGFFPRFSDKLKAAPEYLEIMVVPMVFRVIRIAEALSASAETRGIALKNRRDSYIALKIGPADICFICLLAALTAAGLII